MHTFNHQYNGYQQINLSEEKLVAEVMTSSCVDTTTGILRQPGDFSILTSSFMVSWRMLAGHMSILVITTNTGTLSARAKPRCSIGNEKKVVDIF